jgi:DNA-binding response OmpR family regulator
MRVLVVEDEVRLALLLKRGLEEEGYAVDTSGDGAEALWHATETEYDAIVLDVMLPSMDGLEVTRRLRAERRWTPVLLLTARDAIDDRVLGLDAGADDYLVKPFSFAELAARDREVRVGLEVEPELVAPVDADRLRQAVDNLLDNALRVAPSGSEVRLEAGRHNGTVEVSVADGGPGFPAEFLPHAFERFHRADTARTRQHGGAGLGLAIVKAIAQGHGGRAEAANRPGGGAVVRLLLPAP